MADGLEALRERLEDRHERVVDEHHHVLRVIDDVGDLVGEQAHVDGVQNGAHARHGEVGLEVLGRVPRERRDAVAGPHAELLEPAAETVGAIDEIGVGDLRAPTVAHPDDLGARVDRSHALEDQLQRQRMVVLHQSLEHV